MDLRQRWPILDELCTCATQYSGLQIWAFGSMLRTDQPRDLDVLIIYTDPQHVTDLYAARLWEVSLPSLDPIAMTPDEEHDYRFVQVTNAVLLHPQPSGPPPLPPSQNCKTS